LTSVNVIDLIPQFSMLHICHLFLLFTADVVVEVECVISRDVSIFSCGIRKVISVYIGGTLRSFPVCVITFEYLKYIYLVSFDILFND